MGLNDIVISLLGIVLLVIMVAALKRKGSVALCLLPLFLWQLFSLVWLYSTSEVLGGAVVLLLALIPIFIKDKPTIKATEPEEPPKPF
jgi:hypothetical protein